MTAYLDEIYARYCLKKVIHGCIDRICVRCSARYPRRRVDVEVMRRPASRDAADATDDFCLPQLLTGCGWPIGMDHAGDRWATPFVEMALQKAGIAKPGVAMAVIPALPGDGVNGPCG